MNTRHKLSAAAVLLLLAPSAIADPLDPVLGPPEQNGTPETRSITLVDDGSGSHEYGPIVIEEREVQDIEGQPERETPELGVPIGTLEVYDDEEQGLLCFKVMLAVSGQGPPRQCLDEQLFPDSVPRGTTELGPIQPQTIPGTQPVPTDDVEETEVVPAGSTPEVYVRLWFLYEYHCSEINPLYSPDEGVTIYSPMEPTQEDARWFLSEGEDDLQLYGEVYYNGQMVYDGGLANVPHAGQAYAWSRAHSSNPVC